MYAGFHCCKIYSGGIKLRGCDDEQLAPKDATFFERFCGQFSHAGIYWTVMNRITDGLDFSDYHIQACKCYSGMEPNLHT
jgi:hypothetical protein